ncbi:MAG: integrase/recombinase XerC, partial [bacterium]
MSDLRQFLNFLKAQKLCMGEGNKEIDITKIDHIVIRAYLKELYGKNKKTSIARKLASLRSFFKLLIKEERLTTNPAAMVTTPKQEKHIPA